MAPIFHEVHDRLESLLDNGIITASLTDGSTPTGPEDPGVGLVLLPRTAPKD